MKLWDSLADFDFKLRFSGELVLPAALDKAYCAHEWLPFSGNSGETTVTFLKAKALAVGVAAGLLAFWNVDQEALMVTANTPDGLASRGGGPADVRAKVEAAACIPLYSTTKTQWHG